jgi:hypothetical protein
MNLLILPDADGTHARVSETTAKSTDAGGHLLQPGESYRGVPYDVWCSYVDKSVEVKALRDWMGGLAPSPLPIVAGDEPDLRARRKLFGQPPTLSWAILVHGVVMVGVPCAVLFAIGRVAAEPGAFQLERFATLLLDELGFAALFVGPMVGATLWHTQNRKSPSE